MCLICFGFSWQILILQDQFPRSFSSSWHGGEPFGSTGRQTNEPVNMTDMTKCSLPFWPKSKHASAKTQVLWFGNVCVTSWSFDCDYIILRSEFVTWIILAKILQLLYIQCFYTRNTWQTWGVLLWTSVFLAAEAKSLPSPRSWLSTLTWPPRRPNQDWSQAMLWKPVTWDWQWRSSMMWSLGSWSECEGHELQL